MNGTLSPADAMVLAATKALQMLELGTADLETVRTLVPAPVVSMALLMMEMDHEFSGRWAAAARRGDWNAQGAILHEAILWLLTPEPTTGAVA